jgi:hypothetical protein
MVRLLLKGGESDERSCAFQSHNGAIAAFFTRLIISFAQWFQSHNGAIAALKRHKIVKVLKSFNPTMVRLLPLSSLTPTITRFVSIPQWCDCCQVKREADDLLQTGFNPTMVRLLHP